MVDLPGLAAAEEEKKKEEETEGRDDSERLSNDGLPGRLPAGSSGVVLACREIRSAGVVRTVDTLVLSIPLSSIKPYTST